MLSRLTVVVFGHHPVLLSSMKWCYEVTTIVRSSALVTCSTAGGLPYSSAVVYINIYLDKPLITGAVFTRDFNPGV